MLYASSELDAINLILSSVGESPVNSLAESQSVDVDNAISTLEGVSRTIQRKGWEFNTRSSVSVLPDKTNNQIRYNPTWISISSDDDKIYVKRGDYLYNLTDSTFTFEKAISLNIIEAVDFEDLPDVFKTYIVTKAAIQFQTRYLGDDSVSQELVQEYSEAYSDIVQYSIDTGTNMFEIDGMADMLERQN